MLWFRSDSVFLLISLFLFIKSFSSCVILLFSSSNNKFNSVLKLSFFSDAWSFTSISSAFNFSSELGGLFELVVVFVVLVFEIALIFVIFELFSIINSLSSKILIFS